MRAAARPAAAAALLFLCGGLPAPALAQAYQCRMPARVSVPTVTRDGPVRRVPVTGYTMALSWSPEYCRAAGERGGATLQCGGRNGRFGLILHGLWPEGRGGNYPQWCTSSPVPSSALVRRHLCMTPSARLLAHEWAKHGSCMARRPDTYFRVAAILWNSLAKPDLDQLSRRPELNAGAIREAFVIANPGWRADAVGVHLNRRGWLDEIRLCYGRHFMPTRCDARRLGARDNASVRIWRGL
ncbi:ribonuclease T2 family protein [Qipengyuania sp. YIM B01966]|uniref:ribonuclease T2 family protein n=1 Tax=Qipengyuania sp. YIM B01966 TaxID=2778646 RepID=UPI0018F2D3E0|nr:ribonuclease T [Qipengyuania sp. YIM B01966]